MKRLDLQQNTKPNTENDFEIVHMQIRRRAESQSEQIFETAYFTAIAKGYIVEKVQPTVKADDIVISDVEIPQFLRAPYGSRSTMTEDDTDLHIKSHVQEKLTENESETIHSAPQDDDIIITPLEFKKKSKVKKLFIDAGIFTVIFITVFFAVVFFNIYVHRKNIVYGSSMEPTLHENDVVYTTKLSYMFGEPEFGDIVVIDIELEEEPGFFYMVGQVMKQNAITDLFTDPEESDADTCWIKRVVGVAGDHIEFKDNKFYRNGELVEEDYIKTQNVLNYPETSFVVEEGMIYCMGDNRNVSKDSRVVGQIPIYQVIGKVWKIQEKKE